MRCLALAGLIDAQMKTHDGERYLDSTCEFDRKGADKLVADAIRVLR